MSRESMSKGLEPQDRPATEHEVAIVRWMLDHATEESSVFSRQVERIRVVGRCKCGCPTVHFNVDGMPSNSKGGKVVSDHISFVDGMEVGVMLFANQGYLSCLEVYSMAGHEKPFGLPAVDALLTHEECGKTHGGISPTQPKKDPQ